MSELHTFQERDDPGGFIYAMRQSYSKYFNRKYGKSGRVGEKHHFTMEITGMYHHLAAMTYVLRNALHHGLVPIPYAYPHCSANAIFRKEMGKKPEDRLLNAKSFYRFIGRKSDYPSHYKMNETGIKGQTLATMLTYENGRADYRKISDIDLCTEIDRSILPAYGKASVYHLSRTEKLKIGEALYRQYRIGEAQIRRCLAIF